MGSLNMSDLRDVNESSITVQLHFIVENLA